MINISTNKPHIQYFSWFSKVQNKDDNITFIRAVFPVSEVSMMLSCLSGALLMKVAFILPVE